MSNAALATKLVNRGGAFRRAVAFAFGMDACKQNLETPQVILGGRRFNVIHQIGSGGFSDVFLVREVGSYTSLRTDGANEYALKRVISCILLLLVPPAKSPSVCLRAPGTFTMHAICD